MASSISERSTNASARARADRREADRALARYIAERDRPIGPSGADAVTVAEVLDRYGAEHAPTVADTARIGYAILALEPHVGALPVSSLTGAVCRRYAKDRGVAPGTARKELGTLQAALNFAAREGYLTAAPKVWLPSKPAPRDRWLTRDEAAALIRAARRNPKAHHLVRFILTALYTGSRSETILACGSCRTLNGGHIDTETGIMYRRAVGKAETKKRTPPIPVPRRLLAHMRRWEQNGARHVVEVEGQRVASVKRAWATAIREAGIDHATRHDLRHTAITWAMQSGVDKWEAAGFFGLTVDMIESTYGHHHPGPHAGRCRSHEPPWGFCGLRSYRGIKRCFTQKCRLKKPRNSAVLPLGAGLREAGAGGSNPLTPTTPLKGLAVISASPLF